MNDLGSLITALVISSIVGFAIGAALGRTFLRWDTHMHRWEKSE